MVYYKPVGVDDQTRDIMHKIDELHLEEPAAGSRLLRDYLSRGRVRRLMRLMGVEAVYPRKRTTIPGGPSGIHSYKLRGLKIERPNQVWCADITYIPMAHGSMYLFAIMDWYSRKIVAWELSNTLDTGFCLRTLDEAVPRTGTVPEIFNTDQGCQFTSGEWIGRLKQLAITISMDGSLNAASKHILIVIIKGVRIEL